ncbi:MAG: hypothetical protein E7331_04180 [Clostridiales bacterium]|nr:hypothetical protein [Clostridiales bacterium]
MVFDAIRTAILTAAEGGVSEAVAEVQALSQSLCPVESGTLRGSIAAESGGLSGSVSAGSSHGAYVELGTAKMAARPFLYPAFSLVKGTVVGKIAEKI